MRKIGMNGKTEENVVGFHLPFIIAERSTGLILFIGQVMDPS